MSDNSVEMRQRFLCQKLARDKVVERMLRETPSATFEVKYLEKEELKKALFDKLIEEANEVSEEIENISQLKRELCDVLEVVDGLKHCLGISQESIDEYKLKKVEQRGSFKKGYFVHWIRACKGQKNYDYLFENLEKYPIIEELSTQDETCFSFNKLLRDNHWGCMTPGTLAFVERLNAKDLLSHLLLKLQEEASEVVASSDLEEIAEELGDLFEVIESILFAVDSSFEEILKIKAEKAADFGEFKTGLWTEWIELPEGSRLFNYCSAHPEKYKKI